MSVEIPGRLVEDVDVGSPAGDFMWVGEPGDLSIWFMCPCGCGDESAVAVSAEGSPGAPGRAPVWKWDGEREKPTLTPSLHKQHGCGWHGFLTAGVWRTCG